MSDELGTLTRRLVHPTAPVLLTKNGPLGALIHCPRFETSNRDFVPIESLRLG